MAFAVENAQRARTSTIVLLAFCALTVAESRADAQRRTKAPQQTSRPSVKDVRGPRVTTRTYRSRNGGNRHASREVWRSRNLSRPFRRSVLRVLAGVANADAALRAGMYSTRNDPRMIESTKPGAKRFGFTRRARRAWVQMATQKNLRRWVVRNLNRDFKARTRQLERLYDQSKRPVAYDDIIVGAGPNGVTIANQILENDPSRRVLVVDAADTIASTFAEIRSGIKINSSSRAQDGIEAQMFGMGNNNPLPGSPVGVPDLDDNVKWPEAAALADAVTFSAAASGADFLMQSRATRFADVAGDSDVPGRARVEVRGTDGKSRQIYANNVIVTTGLGKPTLRLADARATAKYNKFIAAERKKLDKGETPTLMYYQDALRLVKDSFVGDGKGGDPLYDYRIPYRRAADGQLKADNRRKPKIAVIGSGDSGKTLMNLYFGTGPDEALNSPGRLGQSQLGQLGDLDWVVNDAFRTCIGYINSARARYAQASADIKSGRIVPLEARASRIERGRNGKARVTYNFRVAARDPRVDGDAIPEEFGNVVVTADSQGRVTAIRRATDREQGTTYLVPEDALKGRGGLLRKPRRARIVEGKLTFETTKSYDRVIIATGFKNQAAPLLGEVTGKPDARINDDSVFELINGDVPGLGRGRAIARQVRGRSQFKIAGPNAGTDLIGIGSIAGIEENRVGLKVWSPRNAVLAAQVAKSERVEGAFDSNSLDFRRRKVLKQARNGNRAVASFDRPERLFSRADARLAYETGIGEKLHFKHELGTALDGFDPIKLGRKKPLEITITRRATLPGGSRNSNAEPSSIRYEVAIPALDAADTRAIADILGANEAFIGLLEGKIGYRSPAGQRLRQNERKDGNDRIAAIRFTVPLNRAGNGFDFREITYRSVRPE